MVTKVLVRPTKNSLEDLQRGLRIDQHALEDSCREHAELFYKVANEYTNFVSLRDEAKQDLSETEATADARIRHDIELSGDKVTEKAVESAKLLDAQVKRARERVMDYNRIVGEWNALKEAYSQRGYVLKDMVQLYLARYYSDMDHTSNRAREGRAANIKERARNERR